MSSRVPAGCTAAPVAATGVGAAERAGAVSDAELAVFHAVRPRLIRIAHGVLGGAADAEDMVQDTWIRWQRTDRTKVRNAPTFLATTTTRLAINVIQSARSRHGVQICAQRPELADAAPDPTVSVERRDDLELAVRTLLETLSPAERGAYVLREAFDYAYPRIATVLGLSEANARQLVTRARSHLSREPGRQVGAAEHRRLLEAFLAAARTGHLAPLERLLAADVAGRSRGGRPTPRAAVSPAPSLSCPC
jgi:RNA polymerase sigma-70 factor, ECF subfamily